MPKIELRQKWPRSFQMEQKISILMNKISTLGQTNFLEQEIHQLLHYDHKTLAITIQLAQSSWLNQAGFE